MTARAHRDHETDRMRFYQGLAAALTLRAGPDGTFTEERLERGFHRVFGSRGFRRNPWSLSVGAHDCDQFVHACMSMRLIDFAMMGGYGWFTLSPAGAVHLLDRVTDAKAAGRFDDPWVAEAFRQLAEAVWSASTEVTP